MMASHRSGGLSAPKFRRLSRRASVLQLEWCGKLIVAIKKEQSSRENWLRYTKRSRLAEAYSSAMATQQCSKIALSHVERTDQARSTGRCKLGSIEIEGYPKQVSSVEACLM
jgi:hypothetical protein